MAFALVAVLMYTLRELRRSFPPGNSAGLREQTGASAAIYAATTVTNSGSGPQDRVCKATDAQVVQGALREGDARMEAPARAAVQIDAASAAREHGGKAGTGLGFESIAAARALGGAARIELRRNGCAVARIKRAPRLTDSGGSHSVS